MKYANLTLALVLSLLPLSAKIAMGQDTGLRRLSHGEIVELVEGQTVLFAAKGEFVHEYHGIFTDTLAPTAFRDWDKRIVEGRIELMTGTPGLVCYHYRGNYDNCGFYISDSLNGRIYLDYIDTVEQQTVQTLEGDQLNLLSRVQIRYRDR